MECKKEYSVTQTEIVDELHAVPLRVANHLSKWIRKTYNPKHGPGTRIPEACMKPTASSHFFDLSSHLLP